MKTNTNSWRITLATENGAVSYTINTPNKWDAVREAKGLALRLHHIARPRRIEVAS